MTHSKKIDLIQSSSIALARSRLAVFTLFALAPLGCTLQSGDDAQADALEHTGEVSEAISANFLQFPFTQFEVEIKNVKSMKCLDIVGTKDGANAQQYDCHGGANQRFVLSKSSGSTYQYTIRGVESGKTLDIAGNSMANGGNVDIASTSQRFGFERQSDGSFAIASINSSKCLDVVNARTDNNANVQQYDCNTGTNQRWTITPHVTPKRLLAMHSGRCVDVAGVGMGNGANVQQYDCNPSADNQKWTISSMTVENGVSFFSLVAKHSGKCLDVVNQSMASGANVQQYDCLGRDSQKWWMSASNGGDTLIHNKLSGMCLDVAGEATGNNANIQQYTCNAHTNQRFSWF